MKNFQLVVLLTTALASCTQAQQPEPPPPPPAPDITIDKGIFDVFQGNSHRAVEGFTILRKADGDTQIRGEATLALPGEHEGSDTWTFYPDLRYGGRGVKGYDLRAKYPTGPGETHVRFDGATCTWAFVGPNAQKVGPVTVNLPLDGIILDKRIISHYAIFGLQPLGPGEHSRMSLDPDTARVAEVRVSEPVPARIETPLGNLLCTRLLVTIGSFGVNLWFDPDGFLLRVEIPHYGISAVRRGTSGFPGLRKPDEAHVGPAGEEFQIQDGRSLIAGSFSHPAGNGPFNSVIILGDAGPQDRNGNPLGGTLLWNHYRAWSEAIVDAGSACISIDDSGSGNSIAGREDETISDSVNHARALLAWAREQKCLKGGKVGVIGHGEGALLALQLAVNGDVDFAVLIGAHGQTIDRIFLDQMGAEMVRQGVPDDVRHDQLAEASELQKLWEDTKIDVWKPPQVPEKFALQGAPRDWFRDMMRFDPVKLAAQLKTPVLVMHGDGDMQIARSNFDMLSKALADGKKDATCQLYKGLDHFLMPAITGDAGDSADPDRKVDPTALKDLGKWVKAR
ncbi:MAG: alpha/beta hydrolase [Planctomycetes bacterium]|nr:alpha/beta hydrolase [Planctomycetota bacterium]